MSERGGGNGASDEATDFVLEAEESDDLEAAFKDALDAVDRRSSPPDSGSETEPGEEATSVVEERLAGELRETQDRLMRALADFDNFRKRVDRERAEERRFQGFEILRQLLPVVDNLERALEADGGSVEGLKAGVELTLKQMVDLLGKFGVRRIDSVGQVFDPRVHEAIAHFPDPKVDQPTVSEELEAGYSMNERLLRAARVAVAMPAEDEEEGEAAG